MELQKIARQMIGFRRMMFNNTCSAINVVQDNSESMMNGFLKQFPWITDEARKPLNDSMAFFRESRNHYQKICDEGYKYMEKMINTK